MRLKHCIFALMAMLLSFSASTAFAQESEESSFVAKIGDTTYTAFAEALTAASAMSGDVEVEIYDKVTLNTSFSGSYSSIKFVGKENDAEIYLDVQGYITATGKSVAFEDLTLSKSEGDYITNAGFMNVAFGVYDVTEVTYTNCTFTNGAYASSGAVTFTGCTFYRSYDKYGLWAYGDVETIVEGCTFADYRGIKMYAEGAAKTVDLTVKDTDFSAVTDKPAIVLTYGESVTLEGNAYSSTGTFELDMDGAPAGTTVTSDVAPVCVNDNGACGVLVDGKIYTTVTEAAEVAGDSSDVTLLYSTTDEVEFAEGVNLTLASGVTADNVTVKVSGPVEVATYDELVAALANGGKIKLTADITVDTKITAIDGTELDLNGKTLYINVENSSYNNVTIKNGNIVLGKDDVHVCDGYFLVNEGKTLVVDGVNVTSSADGIKGYAVFHLKTGANLDLLNSTLNIADNEYTAGYIVYAGEATSTVDVVKTTITGSKVNGIVHATTVIDESTVTLTDVIEHGINRSGVTIDDSNVTISGGTGRGITAQHGDLVITGNSTVNISDMGEATIELRGDKNLTIAETATVVLDAAVNNTTSGTISGTVTVSVPVVAKIGETGYASLADAVAAATEGDTVTLVADVTLTETLVIAAGKEVILDLAGKTVSMVYTETATANHSMISNNGNLTIASSVEGGKISYTYTGANLGTTYAANTVTSLPGSVLTVKGGTVENLTYDCGIIAYAIDGQTNGNLGDVTVNIEGGVITSKRQAVRIFANSTTNTGALNISGGDITGRVIVQNSNTNANKAALNITGGTFNTNDYKTDVLYVGGSNSAAIDIDATVSGGIFNGEITETNVTGFISGGTFTEAVAEEYCAEGFVPKENADGTFGVEEKVELPEVVITDIKGSLTDSDPDLTFALNFAIKDIENLTDEYLEKLFAQYGDWYTDYVLTISGLTDENVTFNANGGGDGYLAGQYDAWSENWVSVPFEDVVLANNESIYIMEYAAKLMNKDGLRFTLAEVAEIVQNFDCGVYFTPEFLAANPGLKVDLQLKVFTEDAEGNKVGNIDVATNNFNIEDYVAIVHADNKQTKYCATLADAVAAATEGDTVTMLSDVELTETVKVVGKAITLDLNGKIVSGTCNTAQGSLVYIENGAGLTVKDGAANGGKLTYAQGTSNVGWTVAVMGSLTLESGTIELTGSWSIGYAVDVRPNAWGVAYTAPSVFTMNDGNVVSSDGAVRVASSSSATYSDVSASFVMNGGKIDAAWDGVFIQQSNEAYDVLNFTINGGTIEGGLNPVRVYGPAPTSYVNGQECMSINFNGGTMTYTGTDELVWVIDGVLRVGGGSSIETIVENGNITANEAFAQAQALPDGYIWEQDGEAYKVVEAPKAPEVVDGKIEFVDGEFDSYTNDTDIDGVEITYKRTIDSDWNALYVPFAIPASELLDNFDIAYINDVRETDADDDGELDSWQMELVKIKKTTATLKANHPYFIRSKSADNEENNLNITLTTTLCKATVTELTCSSMYSTYTVKGLNELRASTEFGEADRVLGYNNGETTWGKIADGYSLKPFRFYLTIDGGVDMYSNAQMSIVVRGEDGTTGIDGIYGNENCETVIFDLYGRRVLEPVKGNIYIINGKKVLVQ